MDAISVSKYAGTKILVVNVCRANQTLISFCVYFWVIMKYVMQSNLLIHLRDFHMFLFHIVQFSLIDGHLIFDRITYQLREK